MRNIDRLPFPNLITELRRYANMKTAIEIQSLINNIGVDSIELDRFQTVITLNNGDEVQITSTRQWDQTIIEFEYIDKKLI